MLARAEPASVNRWRARVTTTVFSGAHSQHVVDMGDETTFFVWRSDGESIEDEAEVWLSVAPDDLRAMPVDPDAER